MSPHVKILILNWNGGDVLLDCLESVVAIDYDNFTTIVIDNASSDNSIDNIHNKFPNVEVIALNKNYGYAKAYNKAFKLIDCKSNQFFMLLNNDTVVDKHIITNFINNSKLYLDQNEEFILGGKIYYLDEDKYSENKDAVWYSGGELNLEYGIINHIKQEEVFDKSIISTDYITGCCMFAPAKIFKELNGFDENFYMYCEDVDFSLRSVQKQIFLGVCHEAILWHKVSYSLRSKFNYKKNLIKLSSLFKLYNKHLNYKIRYFSFLLLLLRMFFYKVKSLF